ncbi:MAG: ATP phosphoribosyltransferase regulatory subunit, partial [Actinomycetota bacterium]|nr:ATP phosphoribosyltransferase regulatory subunit [Actinomycetota bacterium]
YYTGIVLEVYAPGLGLPVGGGGRYDGVMREFGAPMPAAGFAVGLERLHIALAEQGVDLHGKRLDAVLGGQAAEAFAAGRRLRDAGWVVRLSDRTGAELVREAAAAGATEALVAADGAIVRLDRAGMPSIPLSDPPAPPAPVTSSAGEGDR